VNSIFRHGSAVFRWPGRERCLEMQMALNAVGIDSSIRHERGEYSLVVDERDRSAALHEIEAYRRENVYPPPPEPAPMRALPGGGYGVLAYVVVLLAVAFFSHQRLFGVDWLSAGRMQAGMVVEGEWWRVFTALTLHLDAAHLLANVVFGSVLGALAAQALGGGVSWLGIVLAGALGNGLNAVVQHPPHSAIGASTAVFAALGIMVAHALYHRRRLPEGRARRWSPLIGGLVLLAFVGMGGARTDVMAHVTGLFCGLLVGFVGSRLSTDLLARREVQIGAAISVVLILVSGWWIALQVARA
jgi:membrane associated rhomboid family serine protease